MLTMGARIFSTPEEYVEHLTLVASGTVPTVLAASYLSSHLFQKATLLRYFMRDMQDARAAQRMADLLWRRRGELRTNIRTKRYSELYELAALDALCGGGVVHRQDPGFLATPLEVKAVLKELCRLLDTCPNYSVAFCREALPFIFIVRDGGDVTLDVRNNFAYQRIQGLFLDEVVAAQTFLTEFRRIWDSEDTVCERADVRRLLEERVASL